MNASGRLQLRLTPEHFGRLWTSTRLRLRFTTADSGRLRQNPDGSGWLQAALDDSGRLQAATDVSDSACGWLALRTTPIPDDSSSNSDSAARRLQLRMTPTIPTPGGSSDSNFVVVEIELTMSAVGSEPWVRSRKLAASLHHKHLPQYDGFRQTRCCQQIKQSEFFTKDTIFETFKINYTFTVEQS